MATSTGRADLGFNAFTIGAAVSPRSTRSATSTATARMMSSSCSTPTITPMLALTNAGGTAFSAFAAWGSGVTSNDKVGDFNGDGKDDLIQLYDGSHTAYVWLTNAGGTLSTPRRSGARA